MSSPRFPQSNGEAERAVQRIKLLQLLHDSLACRAAHGVLTGAGWARQHHSTGGGGGGGGGGQ